MENLNDVEFGSDKSGEEAPILVAQRYLNIFRQVHIFNKAKRDEFDNELLALPTNITDFFKRMPGGRLLVEHIEKVKTERGIAFVKANREDFDEGAGKTDTPVPSGGGVVQAVSGNITIDASFADALAQALANAFRQLPQSPIPTATGASTITADFGNAFDVIAEEIRTSRASLLDVLKETRSITDSVIASQVSISRILEGILATRDRDDTDIADLNNRIIASQASITKLLEGLYTASNKKNAEISEYLNVENRLRRFREEITSDLDISLQKMQELFRLCAQTVQDRKVIVETRPFTGEAQVSTPMPTVNVEKVDTQVSATTSISEKSLRQENLSPQVSVSSTINVEKENPESSEESVHPSRNENISINAHDNTSEFQEHKKKKKKKKKNRDSQVSEDYLRQDLGTNSADVATAAAASVATPTSAIATASYSQSQNHEEKVHTNNEHLPSFDGVIRNKAFKHEDNFDNVRLDLPPLDTDDFDDDIEQPVRTSVTPVSHKIEKQEHLGTSSSHPDFGHDDYIESIPQSHDDLDFVLPDTKDEDASIDDVSDFSDIGHISNIENASNADDDLDFALPDTSFSNIDETEDMSTDNHTMGFENISQPENYRFEEENIAPEFDDDLDFTLPHTTTQTKEDTSETEISSPNDISEDIDFTLPEGLDFANEKNTSQDLDNSTLQKNPYISNHPMFDAVDDDADAIENTLANGNLSEQGEITTSNTAAQEVHDNSSSLDTLMDNFSDRLDTLDDDFVPADADNVSPAVNPMPKDTQEDTGQISPLDAFMANQNHEEDNIVSAQPQGILQQDALDTPSSFDSSAVTHDVPQKFDEPVVSPQVTETDISPLDAFMADRNSTSSSKESSVSDQTSTLASNIADEKHADIEISEKHEPNQSRYSAELDKIREALTSDNIDISSLDQPIELDDYSDDENVGKDDYDDILSNASTSTPSANVASAPNQSNEIAEHQNASKNSDDEDWEWEYVDENGNEIPENSDDEDWEWEYVEDDEDNSNVDDNKK